MVTLHGFICRFKEPTVSFEKASRLTRIRRNERLNAREDLSCEQTEMSLADHTPDFEPERREPAATLRTTLHFSGLVHRCRMLKRITGSISSFFMLCRNKARRPRKTGVVDER